MYEENDVNVIGLCTFVC